MAPGKAYVELQGVDVSSLFRPFASIVTLVTKTNKAVHKPYNVLYCRCGSRRDIICKRHIIGLA